MSENKGDHVKANGNIAREEKKRKWEAKQQEKELVKGRKRQREQWCEKHSSCATFVTEGLIAHASGGGDVQGIPSLLQPYLNLREGTQPSGGDSGASAYFIAEGTETIRLLIKRSIEKGPRKIHINSIFVKPSVLFDEPVNLLQDLERIASQANRKDLDHASRFPFHVFVAEEHVMSKLAGFQISRGALACGAVPQNRNEEWLMNYLHELQKDDCARPLRLLAFDGVSDTSNLGSMIRTSSAFGIAAVILSQDCCDAWYRRAVRVSMGHVFRVPCIRVADLAMFLKGVKNSPFDIVSYAALIDPASDLLLENMEKGEGP